MNTGRIEATYRREGMKMIRALTAYTASREVAEDAVAESFARALRYDGQIEDVSPWVWRVAFRVAASEIGDRARTVPAVDDPNEGSFESSVDLVRALGALSPKQRASIVLHHYAGHPIRDVASIIGSTPRAVRVHLSVGRARLRKILEANDE